MMCFFKTKYSLAHPLSHFNNDIFYHHIGIKKLPKNMICKFGHYMAYIVSTKLDQRQFTDETAKSFRSWRSHTAHDADNVNPATLVRTSLRAWTGMPLCVSVCMCAHVCKRACARARVSKWQGVLGNVGFPCSTRLLRRQGLGHKLHSGAGVRAADGLWPDGGW